MAVPLVRQMLVQQYFEVCPFQLLRPRSWFDPLHHQQVILLPGPILQMKARGLKPRPWLDSTHRQLEILAPGLVPQKKVQSLMPRPWLDSMDRQLEIQILAFPQLLWPLLLRYSQGRSSYLHTP